jgi:hypothetical protein
VSAHCSICRHPLRDSINVSLLRDGTPSVVKDLKESYALEQFDDSPLHQSIKVFADFVARGGDMRSTVT